MQILVNRYSGHNESDISTQSDVSVLSDGGHILYQCYGLEDDFDLVKMNGKTAIPAGTYKIVVRKEGSMTTRYFAKFKEWFLGMLHVVGVPGFTYVYIHIGNFVKDTEGCLLVGKTAGKDSVGRSKIAYKELYLLVINAAMTENLTIIYYDPK